MIKINELIEILNSLGGKASVAEISEYYGKKHNMIMLAEHRTNILLFLKENGNFKYSSDIDKWEYIENQHDYLFVDDMKYYRLEVEVLNSVFGCHYNGFQRGGLYIKDLGLVWFPIIDSKRKENEWEDIYDSSTNVWKEKPLTEKAKEKCSSTPTFEKRFIFAKESRGYRFRGVYKQTSILVDKTRIYEFVDDKVEIIEGHKAPRMIICNICYMKYYRGITDEDNVQGGGGAYPSSNKEGGEVRNFLPDDNHIIHGFVESGYKDSGHIGDSNYAQEISLEKIDASFRDQDTIDGVRVVFISKGPNNKKNIVVGWYDNATVYRKRQLNGKKFGYNLTCKEEDAHIILEEDRLFEYQKKNDDDTYNFGQAQISYPYTFINQSNRITTDSTSKLADSLNEYLNKILVLK